MVLGVGEMVMVVHNTNKELFMLCSWGRGEGGTVMGERGEGGTVMR